MPIALAFDDSVIAVLDNGTARVTLYDREGVLLRMFRAGNTYRDLTFYKSKLLLVPGMYGHAVDVYDLAGNVIGGFGNARSLGICRLCMISQLNSDTVVVFSPERLRFMFYDVPRNELVKTVGFDTTEVVRRWIEKDFKAMRKTGLAGGKMYSMGFDAIDGLVTFSVLPPEQSDETARELWTYDVTSNRLARFEYDRADVGNDVTISSTAVYTTSFKDGSVLKYDFPRSLTQRR